MGLEFERCAWTVIKNKGVAIRLDLSCWSWLGSQFDFRKPEVLHRNIEFGSVKKSAILFKYNCTRKEGRKKEIEATKQVGSVFFVINGLR